MAQIRPIDHDYSHSKQPSPLGLPPPFAKRPSISGTPTFPAQPANGRLRKRCTRNRRTGSNDIDLIQETWLYYHSLPPKIRRTHFSPEERLFLQQRSPLGAIPDAADEALYRWEQRRRAHEVVEDFAELESNAESEVSDTVPATPEDEPRERADSAIEMDESILDSFRWLDEDGELDLTLDPYHTILANTTPSAPPQTSQSHRLISFGRTLSLSRSRLSTSSTSLRNLAARQASTVHSNHGSTPTEMTSRRSHGTRHVPQRSTSSIDPGAKYYQDPEARLKLRVYLASPQKFDEAVEFGFPSLDKQEDFQPRKSAEREWVSQSVPDETGRTFLDDNVSLDLDLTTDYEPKADRERKPATWPDRGSKPSPWQTPGPRGREMTLKMTLTRPDLRTDTSDSNDPLQLAELPPPDEALAIWDDLPEHSGVVKKMWRKIRGRRDCR